MFGETFYSRICARNGRYAIQFVTRKEKKIKFSSYIRKFRRDRLQSHIRLNIYAFPHTVYKEALPHTYMTLQPIPHPISLYMRKISFSFLSVHVVAEWNVSDLWGVRSDLPHYQRPVCEEGPHWRSLISRRRGEWQRPLTWLLSYCQQHVHENEDGIGVPRPNEDQ